MRPLVIIESPYHSPTAKGLLENRNYLIEAMRDAMDRQESPFAGHLLYTQFLNDRDKSARRLGMEMARAFYPVAKLVAVYCDKGISSGMKEGIRLANLYGIPIEERWLWRE